VQSRGPRMRALERQIAASAEELELQMRATITARKDNKHLVSVLPGSTPERDGHARCERRNVWEE